MKIRQSTKVVRQTLKNLKKMLGLAWEMDKKLVIGYFLSGAFAAITAILASLTLKYLIDSLIQDNITTREIPLLVIIILGARYLVTFISNITNWTLQNMYFDTLMRYKLQNFIAYKFYSRLSALDIAHLEDPVSQNLITKARDSMLWRLPDMLRNFSYFLSNIVSGIASLFILLAFGWWVPVAVILTSLPFLYLRSRYGNVQWSFWGAGAEENRRLWYFTWLLSDPTAIREMRIFKSSGELLRKFKETQEYLFRLNKKPLDEYMGILTAPVVLEVMVLFIIASLKLPDVFTGILTVGSFALLINMIDNLNGQVGSAVINYGEMYTNSLFVDHYFDVLALPELIKDSGQPHVFKSIAPPKIEFRNVYFEYTNGHKVLDGVSFVIQPGENVAFVGENGAGKSTIIKLLCRFYDVTSGEILINDVNLKDIKLSHWYDFLGTLFQDFVQYHFTVQDNITLGNPSKHDHDVMKQAAIKSGAYDFIQSLPKGFDTLLGREFADGEELSGGQWQKLAIARAFYEGAPVLILDEPTSAIDAEAEYQIFNNLEKAYTTKTLILVSHRFSTVRNADRIFVVEGGKITESGTHAELLKVDGKYTKMFTLQAKGYQ